MGQTFIDRLADVIHMLQLARKTGQLSVEHSAAGSLSERGTICFVNGQITQAGTGAYRGASALEKLKTWQDCHFVFCPGDSQPSHQEVSGQNNGIHKELPALPAAPYRLQEVGRVPPHFAHMGLSRVHWRLFLLIDGHRSTVQLARLLGRSMQETSVLLFDLERADLIRR